MIEPNKIKEVSAKYEDENVKFRNYLKNRADSEELDVHFLKLHNEIFPTYDCSKCRNCCREYDLELSEDNIKEISAFLGLSDDKFIKEYLSKSEDDGTDIIKKPCCFLDSDGKCRIEVCKPTSCREFPYTNKPERLFSLLGVITNADICPVVFEILQRLKKIYGFKSHITY